MEKIFLNFLWLMQIPLHFTRLSASFGLKLSCFLFVRPRVEKKIPSFFSKKSEISSILTKFRFRANFLFAKIVHTSWHHLTLSVLKFSSYCKKSNFQGYLALSHIFSCRIRIFGKMSRKQIVLRKPSQKQILSQKCSRKNCHTLVSPNIFSKIVLFIHVDIQYSLFCKKLSEKSTIVNFREIFGQILRKF